MAVDQRFRKLLEPAHIGKVKIRNRIIKTANGTSSIEPTGYVSEWSKVFYGTLARGGAGLVIVESCGVEYPLGVQHPPAQFHLDEDKFIPSYKELTDVVHKYGCPVFLQFQHAGPWDPTGTLPKRDTKAASAMTKEELPSPGFAVPRALSLEEVKEYIEIWVKAAERAQRAGFDGVEINGATCHQINTFFSRVWNKRTDEYGCDSLENRSRFMCDIIRETKKRLGKDFAVTALFNIAEFGHEKGTTIEEGLGFARLLEQAGADAIQLRAYFYHQRGRFIQHDRLFYPEPPESLPPGPDWSHKGVGALVPLIVAVKKIVSVPVFGACRFDPVLGEKLLRQGKLDFVGMTRRLLADPELPNKVAAGRLEDIVPCSGCLYCNSVRDKNKPLQCRVNANLARGGDSTLTNAEKLKRVLVVGGGPAGLETARVAALRGHEVILCEKSGQLGGLLPLASLIKDLEQKDILSFIRYLKTQAIKSGVTIKMKTEVTPTLIKEINPDTVVLAGGGVFSTPDIPGIQRKIVINSSRLHGALKRYMRFTSPLMLDKLTKIWMPIGKKVVIIGGAIQGCELAEFLIKRGRQVTIVDSAEQLGDGMTPDDQLRLFSWMKEKGAVAHTGAKYEEINESGLVIVDAEGKRLTIEADNVLIALPLSPNIDLVKNLSGVAPAVHIIGDCQNPHLIADAIADGSRIANMI